MVDKPHILVVDDDVKLTELISAFLRDNGYYVEVEHRGDVAIERIVKSQPRLVVLDIMLPGADGLAVCRAVRARYSGPIIMLTALNDDIDEVAGLEIGADDYLGKPIKPRLLLAHIRALLRRIDEPDSPEQANKTPKRIDVGDIVLDAGSRQASRHGEVFDLTTAEFDLLWLLGMHAGQVLSREEIHQRIFRVEYDGVDRTIDLRISRIRKKIGDDPRSPHIIKTVRGSGYLFAAR
ncbi:response regulator [Permianibacter aggregans]|uniref:Two-component system response regulator RstA n=1 Tax=Permianibacter aggregans TaxID=1510150 RepID=A0A4R6UU16_9GAMM|nr:response regulator [Permianibacter aggregans]QGX38863.1 response regulator [Permianibacter aggregans]TDQ50671.1 two-component system response regulator RstA [Permianibacter aggregans]